MRNYTDFHRIAQSSNVETAKKIAALHGVDQVKLYAWLKLFNS